MTNETIQTELLPVTLSESEKADFAKRAAVAAEEILTLRTEAKEVAKDFKKRIDEKEENLKEWSRCVSTGVEYREIEVIDKKSLSDRRVTRIRRDTGEIIRVRAMTSDEEQTSFDELDNLL